MIMPLYVLFRRCFCRYVRNSLSCDVFLVLYTFIMRVGCCALSGCRVIATMSGISMCTVS